MTPEEIEELLPALSGYFEITSPANEAYNCVAWCLNDTKNYWWPAPFKLPGVYWPPGIKKEETVEAFIALFEDQSFIKCESRDFELDHDKIAIFGAPLGTPTHAARWRQEDRGWNSKLGEENDILHHSLESIEGEVYGRVVQVMKRNRSPKLAT